MSVKLTKAQARMLQEIKDLGEKEPSGWVWGRNISGQLRVRTALVDMGLVEEHKLSEYRYIRGL